MDSAIVGPAVGDCLLFNNQLLKQYQAALQYKDPLFFYNGRTLNNLLSGRQASVCDCMTTICLDRIEDGYARLSCRMVKERPQKVDMVYLLSKPQQEIRDQQDLQDSTLGFLIAQLGECALLPNVFSVLLICSPCGKGRFLMGAFLYCLLLHPNQYPEEAVLELAGSYGNRGGFCMYQSFGFQPEADSLRNRRCFEDAANLPMKTNLVRLGVSREARAKEVVDIVLGKRKLRKLPFCSFSKERQVLYGMAQNLLDLVEAGDVDSVVDEEVDGLIWHPSKLYNLYVEPATASSGDKTPEDFYAYLLIPFAQRLLDPALVSDELVAEMYSKVVTPSPEENTLPSGLCATSAATSGGKSRRKTRHRKKQKKLRTKRRRRSTAR